MQKNDHVLTIESLKFLFDSLAEVFNYLTIIAFNIL